MKMNASIIWFNLIISTDW